MIKRLILFLVLNFSALFIGSLFTSSGVVSLWYQNLQKAPWAPPGWMFGAAWTLIMVCFAMYMAFLFKNAPERKRKIFLFSIQWLLNVSWSPIFFYAQHPLGGLVCIVSLLLTVLYLFVGFFKEMKIKNLLLAPYLLWLALATSLNAYIFIYN